MVFYQALLVSVVVSICSGNIYDNYISKCSVNGKNKKTCAIDFINYLRPYLKVGVKDLQLPSYDPLVFPYVSFVIDSKMLKASASLNNFSLYNLLNYELLDYQQNERTAFEDIMIPNVYLNSNFVVQGSISNFPLEGDGVVRVDFPSIRMRNTIVYETTESKKKTRCKVISIKSNLTIPDVAVKATGLVGGEFTNALINAYSKMIATELQIVIGKIFEEKANQKISNACQRNKRFLISTFFA